MDQHKKEGRGKLLQRASGRTYDGEWADDRYCGEGTFTFPNGLSWSGVFVRGTPTDQPAFNACMNAKDLDE